MARSDVEAAELAIYRRNLGDAKGIKYSDGRRTMADLVADYAAAIRADEREKVARLVRAVERWSEEYGWWDDDDTLHTCGICNEEGSHDEGCPSLALAALKAEEGE